MDLVVRFLPEPNGRCSLVGGFVERSSKDSNVKGKLNACCSFSFPLITHRANEYFYELRYASLATKLLMNFARLSY